LFIATAARWGTLACLGIITGCTTPGVLGLPWVPQGPGIPPEAVRAERETKRAEPAKPAPAPQRSAAAERRIESAQTPAEPMPGAMRAGLESYAQAARYGDLVFVSGQIALDARTGQLAGARIEEQSRLALENIRAVLESHRLTLSNIVSVTVYLKDINDFRGMDTVYETYFRGAVPARSVVEVSRLPRGALIEISVIAGR
jgi:2-iminobutanoate/2-iminopropanoate deaminase